MAEQEHLEKHSKADRARYNTEINPCNNRRAHELMLEMAVERTFAKTSQGWLDR